MEIAKLILEYLKVIIWPMSVVCTFLLFRKQVAGLLARINRAQLPGGFSVDLAEQIQEAKALSVRAKEAPPRLRRSKGPAIPLTEANRRMIQLRLRPSPSGLDMAYYEDLAEQDPNIALAGLRIELDILARNLATGFEVPIEPSDFGNRLLRKLYSADAIDEPQFRLSQKILQVCNAAAHGESISYEQAMSIIESAGVLAGQYIDWLSWGFPDDEDPSQ